MNLLASENFLPLANLVATHGIKYFIETDAKGNAEGLEAAARLNLHAFVCDTNPRSASVLSQRYPLFDLYDGDSESFLLSVLPKLDAPAYFLVDTEEQAKTIEAASGGNDWHFDFKDVEGRSARTAERNIQPADASIEPGLNPDGTPSVFDRNFVGPPELKPAMYRSQSEKDTWYAIVVENEYHCPQFLPTDIVIDIGANIGSFVKRAHLMGSREIYGFEPSAYYLEAAKANVGDLEGVRLFQQAVVRSDEKRKAQYFHDGGMGTFVDHGDAVESASLDEILEELGPVRFLKIDAEGAEYPVLMTSKRLHLVQEIAGEFHLGNFAQDLPYDATITDLEASLRGAGFDQIVFIQNAASTGNFYCRRGA